MSEQRYEKTMLLAGSSDQVHLVRKELQRAHIKYARIAPVRSLKSLSQGDVVISKSGNIRLVTSIQGEIEDPVACFLTKSPDGALKLENALVSKIDIERIESVILKRSGNPLKLVSQYLGALEQDAILYRNTLTLLKSGKLGEELERRLLLQRRNQDAAMLTLHVREFDGLIVAIGARLPKEGERRVAMRFNFEGQSDLEYIQEANFYAQTPVSVKEQLLTACLLANCIENARLLEEKSKYIQRALGQPVSVEVHARS
ncbi:MAG: hypothetical protein KDD62_05575 [Bdellovibrionales bacterium]|nr:hypothetical protein [Bdellovibrionales bacterium]